MKLFYCCAFVGFLAFAVTYSCAADAQKWNYKRDDAAKGPSGWGKLSGYPECALNKNSPIDIVKSKVVKKETQDWMLTAWDAAANWTVTDSGYTVKFSLEGSKAITTSGGDLGSEYKLVQFHFHWGENNTKGSEHTVDGSFYPLEVHFVHHKKKFADLSAALGGKEMDALAAVGVFFKLQPDNNTALAKILNAIPIVRSNTSIPLENHGLDALTSIFGSPMNENYYRYSGGLTTPGCQQVVRWTVFETPVGISEAQMNIFRAGASDSYGTEFYRPVQPLGSRIVSLYDPKYVAQKVTTPKTNVTSKVTTPKTNVTPKVATPKTCGAGSVTAFWSLFILSVIVYLF